MKVINFKLSCVCLFFLGINSDLCQAQEKSFFKAVGNELYIIENNTLRSQSPGANLPQYSMVDLNNDSKLDVFIYDKSAQRVLTYLYVDGDSFIYNPQYEPLLPMMSDWALFVDYNADGKPDLWTRNDELNSVMIYKNITTPKDPFIKFQLISEALRYYNFSSPIDTSNVFCDKNNLPAIADVDNDGDIDFLTLQSSGLGVSLFLNNCKENNLSLETLSFESPDDCWADFSESANSNDIFLERYPFCRRTYYRYKKHAGGSALLLFDKDNDGDKDLLLGNAGYKDLLFLTNGKSEFNLKKDSIITFTNHYPESHAAKIHTFAAPYLLKLLPNQKEYLFVASAEGDEQSYAVDQSGRTLIYKNTAQNGTYHFELDSNNRLNNALTTKGAYSYPAVGDINGDGQMDLLVASNGNKFLTQGLSDRVAFYLGDKQRAMTFAMQNEDFLKLSEDSLQFLSLALGDINGDNLADLILGSDSGQMICYVNTTKNDVVSFEKSQVLSQNSFNFLYPTPHLTDVNKDGLVDLLVGSKEGPTTYYRNVGTANTPEFKHITDTFGGINNNPIVRRTMYDPKLKDWVDTFMHDDHGYQSLTSFTGNHGEKVLVYARKDGVLTFYTPINLNEPEKTYQITSDYFKNDFAQSPSFHAGKRATICYANIDTAGNDYLITGSVAGGLSIFKRQFVDTRGILTFRPEINLFPNPTKDVLHIHSNATILSAEVVDYTGQLIGTSHENTINLSAYPTGMYFIRIIFENNYVIVKKILKI